MTIDGVPTTTARPNRSISDVAAEAGVAVSAVRFYERYGLVHSERTAGNQRRFDDQAACRIKVARVAQRVGLSVREIAVLLDELPDAPDDEAWRRFTVRLVGEARARVDALEATLDDLGSDRKLCDLGPVGTTG